MASSTLTKKGQTTIPKQIRKFLGLSPMDKIIYQVDPKTQQVILNAISGNILELRGVVPHAKGSTDLKKQRVKTKQFISKRHK
ncbi:MAG: type II toxin-antitoxin system PrlF family antitoxin [Bacteroidetes bacterium]|nr:type II toxin-antitoxin system PrlF family antitoxin [Candidatus Omnitrophota bacterium]MBU1128726.1 type II toxin-antitoxin system PrlF family antitoxin [Candidatus Omnitrophota bacterium]MBU1800607.1 type II toxin-antitoxin system PrlF family antitoxin [Bacteroidota bacterium]